MYISFININDSIQVCFFISCKDKVECQVKCEKLFYSYSTAHEVFLSIILKIACGSRNIFFIRRFEFLWSNTKFFWDRKSGNRYASIVKSLRNSLLNFRIMDFFFTIIKIIAVNLWMRILFLIFCIFGGGGFT